MNTLSYSKINTKFCLELGRVKLLLEKANSLDKKFKIIHVAGTNGKGSVCSFIEKGLFSMGIKCGRFSSPELFSIEDTITVNGVPIAKNELANISQSLAPLCDEVLKELGKSPSGFEVLFVCALIYFANKHCNTVILECGMGGLGDATNAICKSDIAVFTKIDLDHVEYLGNTIEQITANKCGILREGINVFSAVQCEEAKKVIVNECKKLKCKLVFSPPCKIIKNEGLNIITDIGYGNIKLSLAGNYQASNAALSIAVLKEIGAQKKDITYALTNAVNKARLEEIEKNIYFDGAHNPLGVKELVESINKACIPGKIGFAIGFMADKDISGCLDELKKLDNKNFEIYPANVRTNPRSEKSENLAILARQKGYKAQSFDNISDALITAKKNNDTVFAFGSLYMYKELFSKKGKLLCE